jgi:hypothetical protein
MGVKLAGALFTIQHEQATKNKSIAGKVAPSGYDGRLFAGKACEKILAEPGEARGQGTWAGGQALWRCCLGLAEATSALAIVGLGLLLFQPDVPSASFIALCASAHVGTRCAVHG